MRPGLFTRRRFLGFFSAASGAAVLRCETVSAPRHARTASALVDVNVSLSQWPLRRLALSNTTGLVAKLRGNNVISAWAGTFDGLLHKDLAGVNARLTHECQRNGRGVLRPFGSINPMLPDWEEELRRCADEHRMPGIRLHPNYHGYSLSDPNFARLLKLAAERRLIVQLALVMEDERMMHPLLQARPVDTAPLAGLVKQMPSLRLVLLNALRTLRAKPLLDLIAAGNVFVEISMLEGIGGVGNLLQQVPSTRVLFGSHAPLFYFESSLFKLRESPLSDEQMRNIRAANARTLAAAFQRRTML